MALTLNGGWVSRFGLLWLLRTGPAAQGRSGVLSEGNRGATRYFMTRRCQGRPDARGLPTADGLTLNLDPGVPCKPESGMLTRVAG